MAGFHDGIGSLLMFKITSSFFIASVLYHFVYSSSV